MMITRFNNKKSMLLIKIAYIKIFIIAILMSSSKLLKIKITF